MESMFNHCNSLISLNLSNFNISKVENMYNLFFECSKLEYINISNFDKNINCNYFNMFLGTMDKLVNYLNNKDSNNKIILQLKSKKCSVEDCLNDWKQKRKIILDNNICIN